MMKNEKDIELTISALEFTFSNTNSPESIYYKSNFYENRLLSEVIKKKQKSITLSYLTSFLPVTE